MNLHRCKLRIQKHSTVMNINNMENLNFAKFNIYFHFCKTAACSNRILLYLFRYLCCKYR